LFIRFVNKEVGVSDLIETFLNSPEVKTKDAAVLASQNPPDLEPFRKELTDAVRDLIRVGLAEEFSAFVNHYMEDSLEEDVERVESQLGQNISRTARVKDPSAPWIQGFICYNLCLYIKAFGLQDLKSCRVCGKIFDHKGKYAVYCSDLCKAKSKEPQ
jgi:hypothetical protein